MIGTLPEHLTVGDTDYPIRSDYRNVLQIFEAFNDPELEPAEKWIVAIYLLFEDFSCADDVLEALENGFPIEEAMKQINWFISAGKVPGKETELPVYDWAQDEQMIFSAVNKVAGKETRELEYLHWWTFLGYFNEVGEGTFSFIVGIRNKLNKGKKLEKHEKEFLSHNKELVKLEKPKSKEEQEQEDAYNALLDEVLG
ncbi:MAG: hypothetical protein HDR01_05755 [Lachnospiraceae bacterium]|nr:hypothetical protein [Lachnospiraceae bacterium]